MFARLASNSLGDARQLGDTLSRLTRLEVLAIRSNDLCVHGGASMAAGLQCLSNLTKLQYVLSCWHWRRWTGVCVALM